MTCEVWVVIPHADRLSPSFSVCFCKNLEEKSHLSCVERARENRVVAKFLLALLHEAITVQTSSQDLKHLPSPVSFSG